ncbi:hypothetical protein H310_14154 [Aphanomyces invadans]|uniref:Uncharacterized protein n=2 Tax=Aphanomyces invadans TaxID=157072 RepID=A0A024TCR0_9STRA|nr:hypothetical protein H310_14154 [Aphanomyces invadans]ETV91142.1 hypothetical protein H310_14154 [Aphanomyces invadans]|eukprot:XP_008880173.1 hypothetical protein H310_14154 [Aphanomyces invadans]
MCITHGDTLTAVSCRKRFDDFIVAFKEDKLNSLRASGTEEEYNEREQLMQDIVDLMNTSQDRKRSVKEEKTAKFEKRESGGERLRDAAMRAYAAKRKSIDAESDVDVPPDEGKEKKFRRVQKVPDTTSALERFAVHLERANEFKSREIESAAQANALAQRRLELDEARFTLDKSEREA